MKVNLFLIFFLNSYHRRFSFTHQVNLAAWKSLAGWAAFVHPSLGSESLEIIADTKSSFLYFFK